MTSTWYSCYLNKILTVTQMAACYIFMKKTHFTNKETKCVYSKLNLDFTSILWSKSSMNHKHTKRSTGWASKNNSGTVTVLTLQAVTAAQK